jgi:hypothetical protein
LRRVSTKVLRIPPAGNGPNDPTHQGTQYPSTHTYRLLLVKEQAATDRKKLTHATERSEEGRL